MFVELVLRYEGAKGSADAISRITLEPKKALLGKSYYQVTVPLCATGFPNECEALIQSVRGNHFDELRKGFVIFKGFAAACIKDGQDGQDGFMDFPNEGILGGTGEN
jgi:hypothetical protein